MHIYQENDPAKLHPDPIWNDGTSGFIEEVVPNKNIKMSSDMESLPGPKIS